MTELWKKPARILIAYTANISTSLQIDGIPMVIICITWLRITCSTEDGICIDAETFVVKFSILARILLAHRLLCTENLCTAKGLEVGMSRVWERGYHMLPHQLLRSLIGFHGDAFYTCLSLLLVLHAGRGRLAGVDEDSKRTTCIPKDKHGSLRYFTLIISQNFSSRGME